MAEIGVMKARKRAGGEIDNDKFIERFYEFIKEITYNGYYVLPMLSNFCEYTGIDRRLAVEMMERPEVSEYVRMMIADTLAQGAALGFWKEKTVNLALKNLCGWTDKVESKQNLECVTVVASEEEAQKALREYVARNESK